MKSGCVLVKSARCIGFGSGRIQTGRELAEVSAFRIKPQLSKRKTHKATLHRVRIGNLLLQAVKNPVVIAAVLASVWNAVNDPTTAGLKDSQRAMAYEKPYRDGETQ